MTKPLTPPTAPRSPLPVEAVRSAQQAAAGTKTDFRSLLASSLSESRHDPQARKPTVTDPAGRAGILALRSDSNLAGALAARYSDENRVALGKSLGRKVSENEVRMAYLLGATGASRLLRASRDQPTTPVDKLLPSAVKSNPGLFHNANGEVKTAREAVASLQRHFDLALRRVNDAIGSP